MLFCNPLICAPKTSTSKKNLAFFMPQLWSCEIFSLTIITGWLQGHELTLRVLYRLFGEAEVERDFFSSTTASSVYEMFLLTVVWVSFWYFLIVSYFQIFWQILLPVCDLFIRLFFSQLLLVIYLIFFFLFSFFRVFYFCCFRQSQYETLFLLQTNL